MIVYFNYYPSDKNFLDHTLCLCLCLIEEKACTFGTDRYTLQNNRHQNHYHQGFIMVYNNSSHFITFGCIFKC